MNYSNNYSFNLPSRDGDDIVDVNLISENFEKIDGLLKTQMTLMGANRQLVAENANKIESQSTLLNNIRTKVLTNSASIAENQIRIRELQVADEEILQKLEKIENSGGGGKSAYEIWIEQGNTGTEEDFLASLKGDDYTLTEADKEEIAETVKAEVPLVKTAEQPIFVNSVDEMTDTSKVYVMPDGYMWAYMTKEVVVEAKDLFQNSGYQLNYRHSSSGVTAQTGAVCSGFISIADAQANDYKLRIKGLPIANLAYATGNGYNRIAYYKTNGQLDTGRVFHFAYPTGSVYLPVELDGDDVLVTLNQQVNGNPIELSDISQMKVSLYISDSTITDADVADIRMTFGEGGVTTETGWFNTGHTYIPADYEERIIELEKDNTQLIKDVANCETRLDLLENNAEDSDIPDYWLDELETKADTIQQAMESAGRNKSAFLWYTDSHWTAGNSKVSPALLKYLYLNTPMNKVNFGGDIIGDPATLTHNDVISAYEWREMIKGLPNHHSVIGNHDNLHKGRNDLDVSKLVYSFLIAPEESTDMVMGGDLYYYIDNPCEKTRYLYLDSGRKSLDDDETKFIIDSLTSVTEGWHVVVISHIWFQYKSASTPAVGSINVSMQKALDLFDAYNARQSGNITMVSTAHSYDFSACGGKVEFCIGGHIHVDHDITSTGGIPVILTASDVNQERSSDETEDSGTTGTITESAIFGIIANYNNNKITVVGVGRGTSREISY